MVPKTLGKGPGGPEKTVSGLALRAVEVIACLRRFVAPMGALGGVKSVVELSVASAVDVSLRARSFSLSSTICAPRSWSNET
jgi:hypothetical protein